MHRFSTYSPTGGVLPREQWPSSDALFKASSVLFLNSISCERSCCCDKAPNDVKMSTYTEQRSPKHADSHTEPLYIELFLASTCPSYEAISIPATEYTRRG